MSGKGEVRFHELFGSTVEVHGVLFALEYYVLKGRMELSEFNLWLAVVDALN